MRAEKCAHSWHRPVDALAIVQRACRRQDRRPAVYDENNLPLEISRAWLAYRNQRRPQSGPLLRQYENHWSVFSAWLEREHPETRLLRDITSDMAGAFIRYLAGPRQLSGGRINKYIRFLTTFFRVLAEQARAAGNPFEKISTRRHIAKTRRPLTIEELKLIIETADGELKTLFMLGTFTGLRLADCALLWRRWLRGYNPPHTAQDKPFRSCRCWNLVLAAHLANSRASQTMLRRAWPNCTSATTRSVKTIARHMEQCGIETTQEGTGKGTDSAGYPSAFIHCGIHISAYTPSRTRKPLQKLAGHVR